MAAVQLDWFLDEFFWIATYPFMFPPDGFARAAAQVEELVALTSCSSGSVLDLACGPGRFAVPLAQRGLAVTGVDSTAFLLDKARALAASTGAQVEWVHEDMRSFVRPGAFDLALSMFTSFGFFDAPEENLKVLENVAASLRPGGAFVIDVLGREVLARIYEATRSVEAPGSGLLITRSRVVDDWTRVENEWVIVKDGTAQTLRFRHWLYGGTELRAMLLGAGFATVQLHGSCKGTAYSPGAERLIAVARKGAE
jgi:SAM-dependent methyltransferase